MKLLFVHRTFPGQFVHLVEHLRTNPAHHLVFITERPGPHVEGVVTVPYIVAPASPHTHFGAQDLDAACRRAQAVAEVASGLREAGFVPDVIIGHDAWGELLHLADLWPRAGMIAYREYYYHLHGADVGYDPEFPVSAAQEAALRTRNAIGLLGLAGPARGVTPTLWQRGLYPAWAQTGIVLVPDGVNLDLCRPDPSARAAPFTFGDLRLPADARLVTFVARDLEPYRGFHTLMRALPTLLARPDVHVACVGGDGVSYGPPPPAGTWKQNLLAEHGSPPWLRRLHFTGRIPYRDHIRLLQRSDVHLYLSYPFIPSWSLREAIACGCAIVAADTAPVRELTESGVHACLIPGLDPQALAAAVLHLLDNDADRSSLAANARAYATTSLGLVHHLAAWGRVVQ